MKIDTKETKYKQIKLKGNTLSAIQLNMQTCQFSIGSKCQPSKYGCLAVVFLYSEFAAKSYKPNKKCWQILGPLKPICPNFTSTVNASNNEP